ncbi:MAG: hypothetical protein O2913_05870 [Chloroflexi bacterium]|nr:hypothetical protein [Chloroflexota bacterium]
MSAAPDRSTIDRLFPVDAVTPMTCVHLGIEYRGEVIRASRWSSRLIESPGEGCHFKIVLVQEPPRRGLPILAHHRNTAICVPTPGSGRQVHRIIGEMTAAKQATYLTRRDVDAALINSVFREREHELDKQLVLEESARFAKGIICVQGVPGPDPEAIFTGQDPIQWMERLARWILAYLYPNLPIDTHDLTPPISEDDAARLFASVFKQAGSDSESLARLGPRLGLVSGDSGGTSERSECRVFELLRSQIDNEPVSFAEVHRFLAYDVGLTAELASLFILLFIYHSRNHSRPEYQIQLRDDAEIFLADGSALRGGSITPDLVPLLAWDSGLASKATTIVPISTPRFANARHHLSILCPELPTSDSDAADNMLARCIQGIARDINRAGNILGALEASQEPGYAATVTSQELKDALERLGRISGGGYADIYHSIRAAYPNLPKLKEDLETLEQLGKLEIDSEEIFRAQRYISDAQVPMAKFPNLAVDRETLLTGLSPSRLTRSKSRGWSSVARDAEGFKIRYTKAYREHHRQYHDELPVSQSGLLSAKKKQAALELLNTLDELGQPTGAGLEAELAALPAGTLPCSFQWTELDLSDDPCCPECRLSLTQTVPTSELARLTPQVDMALGEKTQKLSKLLVEKVLAGRTDDHWTEFLQIVQASELSSLANTLDANLISFIQQVLD